MRNLADNLGFAPTAVLVAAVVWGAVLALLPGPDDADLRVWTFARTHADAMTVPGPDGRSAVDVFAERSGRSVRVELLPPTAMDLRLNTLARARGQGPAVVQIELLSAAKHLNRPTPPFAALDDLADLSAFRPSAVDTWRRGGRVYGVPLDVHPTALVYRTDLWRDAGLDPADARDWHDFLRLAETYRRRTGRAAIEFSPDRADHLVLLLRQRGIDPGSRDALLDPRTVDTILFAARLAAAGSPTSRGHGRWARDLADGRVATLWMPDWRLAYLQAGAPGLAGRVDVMPLPPFEPGDAPTATWGGTMLAIPGESSPDAVALLTFLATDPAAAAGRRRTTYIVPAMPGGRPAPSALLGEAGADLYARLADAARPSPVTPRTLAASAHLATILAEAAADPDAASLPDRVARRLAAAHADLARRDRLWETQKRPDGAGRGG